MVLIAARGTLRQQLAASAPSTAKPRPMAPGRQFQEEPSVSLPFMELKYFNGPGGLRRTEGIRHLLGRPTYTASDQCHGESQVRHSAFRVRHRICWAQSQNDRLTPWFNDPISDPPGTAIYIRDDDIGAVWSPTPKPIREKDAYRARHGQGYTTFEHNSHAIEQRLSPSCGRRCRGSRCACSDCVCATIRPAEEN